MTDASVTWNDERVEQLKKLWAEGKSASQIAAEIGGVSRNAVIGKVHRLGLSGRPKAGGSPKPRKSADSAEQAAHARSSGVAAPENGPGGARAHEASATSAGQGRNNARHHAGDGESMRERAGSSGAASRGSAAPAGDTVVEHPAAARAGAEPTSLQGGFDRRPDGSNAASDVVKAGVTGIAFPERVTIMDLREGMCRWPVGDPTSPDFHFCGARSEIGSPYCEHHAQIAYQPADRRREKKQARG